MAPGLTRSAGVSLSIALALFGTACSSEVTGQIVIAVQTDVHLPKDIDTIRIEVRNEGVPKFLNDYERLGTPEGAILLPGTLTLIASDDPADAIQILVSAFTGGREGNPRIVREAVTTIPPERTVTLQLPLQFLCDGSGKIEDGNAASDCPEGQTCIAGHCEDKAVDSATLPDFDQDDIFVPGVCLDVAVCFNLGDRADIDMDDCTIDGVVDQNVALQTEGDGICGAIGCFVALDANSALGWQTRDDGRVQLPPAVCEQIGEGKIVNVVTADANAICPVKEVSVPTCGPWSAAGPSLPFEGPTVLSGGQQHPLSLSLGPNSTVVWTNGGTLTGDGTVKAVATVGGTPTLLADDQVPPRDITVGTDGTVFWTTAVEGMLGTGQIVSVAPGGMPLTEVPNLDLPEGLAVRGGDLFWTDFQPDGVGGIFGTAIGAMSPVLLTQTVNYPFRIVADETHVYWTDEGTLGQNDGAVRRIPAGGGAVEAIAADLPTPRGLVLDMENGRAKSVFWTLFDDNGTIMRAEVEGGGSIGNVETIVTGQSLPNHLTIDDVYIYWTNRGDGTVRRVEKDAPAGTAPFELANNQRSPGEIAVDGEFVYWVNEGTSAEMQLDGSVVRLDKPL